MKFYTNLPVSLSLSLSFSLQTAVRFEESFYKSNFSSLVYCAPQKKKKFFVITPNINRAILKLLGHSLKMAVPRRTLNDFFYFSALVPRSALKELVGRHIIHFLKCWFVFFMNLKKITLA